VRKPDDLPFTTSSRLVNHASTAAQENIGALVESSITGEAGMRGSRLRVAVLAGGLVVAATAAAVAVAGTFTGPSSSQAPYVIPSQPNVHTVALLTVGDSVQGTDNDAVPGYQMVGIPDGMGAFDNHNGTFTLLMNHELVGTTGIVRDHGATGAFVSEWIISKHTLRVLSGQDLMQQVARSIVKRVVHAPYVGFTPRAARSWAFGHLSCEHVSICKGEHV
jgi:hypothetical protein